MEIATGCMGATRKASGETSIPSAIGMAPGLDHSGKILLEQVDRDHEQNEILQKEARNYCHCWKPSSGSIPCARSKWHDREGSQEGQGRTESTQRSQFLIPESQEQ